MPKPEMNQAKIIARLEAEGWTFHRHGGDHDLYIHRDRGMVAVPRHRTLSPGVARAIARQAGWI
jgi:predicted RNA binding protein YcfA (HicA-like mRNA interferase family)